MWHKLAKALALLAVLAFLPVYALSNSVDAQTTRNLFPMVLGNWWEFEVQDYDDYNDYDADCGNVDGSNVLMAVIPPDGMGRFIGSRILEVFKENPCSYAAPITDTDNDGDVSDEWKFRDSDGHGFNVRWTIPHPKDESDITGSSVDFLQLEGVFWAVRDEDQTGGSAASIIPWLRNYGTQPTGYAPDGNAFEAAGGSSGYFSDVDVEPGRFVIQVGHHDGTDESPAGYADDIRGYAFIPLSTWPTSGAQPDARYGTYPQSAPGGDARTLDHGNDGSGLTDGYTGSEFHVLKHNDEVSNNYGYGDNRSGIRLGTQDEFLWEVEYRTNVWLTDVPAFPNGVYADEISIFEFSRANLDDAGAPYGDWGVCETWYLVDGVGPVKIQNSSLLVYDLDNDNDGAVDTKYVNDCLSSGDTRNAYDEGRLEDADGNGGTPIETVWHYSGRNVLADYFVDGSPYPAGDYDMTPPNAAASLDWDTGNASLDDAANDEVLYIRGTTYWVWDLGTGNLVASGPTDTSIAASNGHDELFTYWAPWVSVPNWGNVKPYTYSGPDAIIVNGGLASVFPNCAGRSTGNDCNILIINGDDAMPDQAVWMGYYDASGHWVDYAPDNSAYVGTFTDLFGNGAPTVDVDYNEDGDTNDAGEQDISLYDGEIGAAQFTPRAQATLMLYRAGAYWYYDGDASPWAFSGDLHTHWNDDAPDLYDMTGPADTDAAAFFVNDEAFTDTLSADEDNYEDPLPSGEGDEQWVVFQDEAVWMKYVGPDWEAWDVCEVSPESQCTIEAD